MKFSKAHFIGIAGKGMSATALLLRQMGVGISGSDEGCYPPVSDYLQSANVMFAQGYRKENIPDDVDVIIVGKSAKLVPETNEEVRAAFASGKPVLSFADILNEITSKSETIVVAGSYGKSTCTALLAWCLRCAKKDPSYFIGEVTNGFERYAHWGRGSLFVIEGDEYPSSNWDNTSKFLRYNAGNVLLTSATHDHINIFPTHSHYLVPFRALLDSLPPAGILVANGNEPYARALVEETGRAAVFYALEDCANWHADKIERNSAVTFDLMRGVEKVVRLSTQLLGIHNIENIIGVSALLLEKGLLSPDEVRAGVSSFIGVKRRMELLSTSSTVPVLEGFGSSYEKAKSAIAAVKLHFPNRRLMVVFEPHTFTWRNRDAISSYDDVFDGAAKVLVYEPPLHGANTHSQLTQDEIVARVRGAKCDAEPIADPQEALHKLNGILESDDVILLLTSGELGGLIKTIPKLAEQKYPNGTAS